MLPGFFLAVRRVSFLIDAKMVGRLVRFLSSNIRVAVGKFVTVKATAST